LSLCVLYWPALAYSQDIVCTKPCALPASQALFVEVDAVPGVAAYTLLVNGLPTLTPATVANGTVSFSLPQGFLIGTTLFQVRGDGVALTDPTPLTICGANVWAANYYPNATLSDYPTVAGCETFINHDWGNSGPLGLPADNFSARYLGTFTFAGTTSVIGATAASYLFSARTDDGMRAWVDSDQILDSWHDQGATSYTATRSLLGSHALVMEYYEHSGQAVAVFGWLTTTPQDPCVVDPLIFTVNRWPSLSTGTRRLDYSVNKTANITLTMRATPWRATAVDTRGCMVTVTK
jgi:hypothetical protein